jgi:hypothetical protein
VIGVSDEMNPGASREALAVAGLMENVTIGLNERATLRFFGARSSGCNLIHLACHGVLQVGQTMPSALRLYDTWLTPEEVLRLELIAARRPTAGQGCVAAPFPLGTLHAHGPSWPSAARLPAANLAPTRVCLHKS